MPTSELTEKLKNQRILITGVSGFVGSYLARFSSMRVQRSMDLSDEGLIGPNLKI